MKTSPLDLHETRSAARRVWYTFVLPAIEAPTAPTMLAALVALDTALDAVLRVSYGDVPSVSGRLRAAEKSFSDYEGLCMARLLRHRAVHQVSFHLCWKACAPALAAYARALLDHGVDLRGEDEEDEGSFTLVTDSSALAA